RDVPRGDELDVGPLPESLETRAFAVGSREEDVDVEKPGAGSHPPCQRARFSSSSRACAGQKRVPLRSDSESVLENHITQVGLSQWESPYVWPSSWTASVAARRESSASSAPALRRASEKTATPRRESASPKTKLRSGT